MSIEHREHAGEVTTTPERFENPGISPHRPRLSDEDPRAAKRAERQTILIFTLSILATVGGIVGYFAFPIEAPSLGNVRMSTLTLGLGLGIGMLGIGVAAVHWAKSLISDVERVEERHVQRSDDATRAAAV